MDYTKKIQKLMEILEINKSKFSKLTGISKTLLTQYEQKVCNPSTKTLLKIEKACKEIGHSWVTLEWLQGRNLQESLDKTSLSADEMMHLFLYTNATNSCKRDVNILLKLNQKPETKKSFQASDKLTIIKRTQTNQKKMDRRHHVKTP